MEQLYRDHLAVLDGYLGDAIERANRAGVGVDAVLFHAGRARTYHADDNEIVFRSTPHFRRWIPLAGPEHAVLARPGHRPRVIRVTPRDYWYETAAPPASYWEGAVDLEEAESFAAVSSIWGSLDRVAYVGDVAAAAAEVGIDEALVEPDALMMPLDWHRAYKTDFEIEQLAAAAAKAAPGYHEARRRFFSGASEREILWGYVAASGQLEREIPYEPIVALDTKAAILHYQHKRGREAAPGKVLLLDAGAAHEGYAADVTRTWATEDADPVFHGLIVEVDAIERRLVDRVTAGASFVDLQLETHRQVGAALHCAGVLKVGADEAVGRGLTRAFLPHGLGHHLGLQVHDVGGRQASPEGGTVDPPDDHPFLRTTRPLEARQVLTVEPGLYFIDLLLDPLRQSDDAAAIDWDLVDRLAPCGGIRIEDDVVVTDGAPRNLTRDLVDAVE